MLHQRGQGPLLEDLSEPLVDPDVPRVFRGLPKLFGPWSLFSQSISWDLSVVNAGLSLRPFPPS